MVPPETILKSAASILIVCVSSVVLAVCVNVPVAPTLTSPVTTSLLVVEFPLDKVSTEALFSPRERPLIVVEPEVKLSVGAFV